MASPKVGEGHIAFVDVDGLLIDVNALVIAVTRYIFKAKIPEDEVLGISDCRSTEATASRLVKKYGRFAENIEKPTPSEKRGFVDLKDHFVTAVEKYGPLCKAYFGSIAALSFLREHFGDRLVFVTSKPRAVLGCLRRLFKAERGDLAVVSLDVSPVLSTPEEGDDSSVVFAVGSPALFELLWPPRQCISKEPPGIVKSYYFIFKSSRLLSFCLDQLFAPPRGLGENGALRVHIAVNRAKEDAGRVYETRPGVVSTGVCKDDKELQYAFQHLPNHLREIDWSALSKAISGNGGLPNAGKEYEVFTYLSRVQPLAVHGPPICPELQIWDAVLPTEATVFDGLVVKGFGRGSATLGIPTANLDVNTPLIGPALPFPGIYLGFAALYSTKDTVVPTSSAPCCYDMVLSGGYSPFYENDVFVIEPYLFHEFKEDFHGARLRLVVVGVLRAEANFLTFDNLIQAIQHDCEVARGYLKGLRENSPSIHTFCCSLLQVPNVA